MAADMLPPQKVRELLDALASKMEEKSKELIAKIDAGEMDKSAFRATMEAAIPGFESEVHEEGGVTTEQVKAALNYYRDSKSESVIEDGKQRLMLAGVPPEEATAARAQLEAMQAVQSMLSAEGNVPTDMTEERLVEIITQNTTISVRKMRETMEEVKASGVRGAEAMMAFQTAYMPKSSQYMQETFEEIGIAPADFTAALQEFTEKRQSKAVMVASMKAQGDLSMEQIKFMREVECPAEMVQRMEQMQMMQMMQMSMAAGGMDPEAMGAMMQGMQAGQAGGSEAEGRAMLEALAAQAAREQSAAGGGAAAPAAGGEQADDAQAMLAQLMAGQGEEAPAGRGDDL